MSSLQTVLVAASDEHDHITYFNVNGFTQYNEFRIDETNENKINIHFIIENPRLIKKRADDDDFKMAEQVFIKHSFEQSRLN